MIRGDTPRKYKPTKSSELPKPRKIRLTKITNRTLYCLLGILHVSDSGDMMPRKFFDRYFHRFSYFCVQDLYANIVCFFFVRISVLLKVPIKAAWLHCVTDLTMHRILSVCLSDALSVCQLLCLSVHLSVGRSHVYTTMY